MTAFKPSPSGFRELGQSAVVAAATYEAAARMAGNANAVGHATYGAVPRQVRAGRNNELRAGAAAVVVTPHWNDTRDRVLVRVAQAMRARGRPS